ncbi:MAG: lipopolysaccharide assembly protein LapA domain-containing protein [Syntrophobacteraceae bacterium]
MRLFKLLVTLLILGLIGIFIYQNMLSWTQPVSFKLNLYFYQTVSPPSLELYAVILLSALGGFIIGIALLLKPHFKTRRLLKRERQEKKQAQEEYTLRLARAESRGEVPNAADHTTEGAASEEKEE